MDDKRLTEEELTALFDDGGGLEEEVELAEVDGIPPEVVPPFAAISQRLLVESFQDLDDFLDLPLDCGEPIATAVPGNDVRRLAEGGVWARFEWSGPAPGGGWVVLPEISARRLLARLLGSRDDEVRGTLGGLHRTSLEAPFEELRAAMVRHLEEDGLASRVHLDPPTFEPPSLEEDELRLLRLECPFQMGEAPLVVCFYAEEGLAACLARIELEQRDAAQEAAREAEEAARDAEEASALAEAMDLSEDDEDLETSGEPETSFQAESAGSPLAERPVPGGVELRAFLGATQLAGGPETLQEGMVLKLDRLAGDLVEVHVGGEPVGVARVIVVEDHYGLRIQRLTRPRRRE